MAGMSLVTPIIKKTDNHGLSWLSGFFALRMEQISYNVFVTPHPHPPPPPPHSAKPGR